VVSATPQSLYSIVSAAGWASRPGWTRVGNLTPTRFDPQTHAKRTRLRKTKATRGEKVSSNRKNNKSDQHLTTLFRRRSVIHDIVKKKKCNNHETEHMLF
jgi:hypothetical protein